MRPCNFRSLLLAAIVLSNCITWTASKHHFTHNVSGHRSRHRRQGAGLYLSSSYVIPGGEGTGWGEWGQVSPCSRTCGGGVASQKRICLQVSSEGSQCTGGDTKYFSCETQDCPDGSQDFRAEQCSEFNNKSIGGVTYNGWEPYTNAPNPCELNCMPHGERFYYRHKTAVVDGTRCNEDSFDVCVQGTCQPVGCDMMLGSNAKEDKCRECRGNGANCYTKNDLIDTQDLIKGYNDILLIPQGATNIRIAEIKASINYLALRPSNGSYYLNGNYHIDFPRSITIAGTIWHYERSQQGFPAPDKLRCLGPITEPIYLSLLLQDVNVGIEYEYSLPKALGPAPVQTYSWVHGEFTPCSASCGGGFQNRNVTCSSSQELKPVDDVLCNEALRPVANQTCNLQECPPQWIEDPWGPCSKPCGDGGTKSRNVYCQKIITNGDTISFPSVVADKECFDVLGKKPKLFEECNQNATCPTWFIGKWAPCDKLCDEGKQTRKVVCRQVTGGKVEVFNDTQCLDEKPATEKSCMLQLCKAVDWVITDWTGCDSCLSKTRTRYAECVTVDDVVVNSSFCSYHRLPILEKPCLEEELPSCEVQWYATQWSPCSVICGKGIQARRVFCGHFNGTTVTPVDDSQCNNTAKYNDTKPCEVPRDQCPAQWFAGSWPECDKECGTGEELRKVLCLHNRNNSDCVYEKILDSTQSCSKRSCEDVARDYNELPYCDDDDDEHPETGIETVDSILTTTIENSTIDEGSGMGPIISDIESSFLPVISTKSDTDSMEGEGLMLVSTGSGSKTTEESFVTDYSTTPGDWEDTTWDSTTETANDLSTTTGTDSTEDSSTTESLNTTESSSTTADLNTTTGATEITTRNVVTKIEKTTTAGLTTTEDLTNATVSNTTADSTTTVLTTPTNSNTTTEPTSKGSISTENTTTVETKNETTTADSTPTESPTTTEGSTTTADSNSTAGSTTTEGPSITSDSNSTAGPTATEESTTSSDSNSTAGPTTTEGSNTTSDSNSTAGPTTTEGSTTSADSNSTAGPTTTEGSTTSADSNSTAGPTTTEGSTTSADSNSTAGPTTTAGSTTSADSNSTAGPTTTEGSITTTDSNSTAGLTTTESSTTSADSNSTAGPTTTENSTTAADSNSTAGPTTTEGSTTTADSNSTAGPTTTEGSSITADSNSTTGPTTTTESSTTSADSNSTAGPTTTESSNTTADSNSTTGSTTTGGSTTTADTNSTTDLTTAEAPTTTADSNTTATTETTTTADLNTTAGPATTKTSTTSADSNTTTDSNTTATTEAPTTTADSNTTATTEAPTTTVDSNTTASPTTTEAPTTTADSNTTAGSNTTTDSNTTSGSATTETPTTTADSNTTAGPTTTEGSTTTSDSNSTAGPTTTESVTTTADSNSTAGPTTTESSTTTADSNSTADLTTTESSTTTAESNSTAGPTTTDSSTDSNATGLTTTEGSSTPRITPWDMPTTVSPPQCKPRTHIICSSSPYGCCPDKKTPATGPFDEGCLSKSRTCNETLHGCCPDDVSPALGPDGEGCPISSCNDTLYGCCTSDNKTAAEGNDQEGCPPPPPACLSSKFGCCEDGETEATGPERAGCPELTTSTITPTTTELNCWVSLYRCCYDNETVASGPNATGCPCNITQFGCCPDGESSAQGIDWEGCLESCQNSTHGCCADGKTPAHGPEQEGCCLLSPFGCCPDNYKPAEGPHLEGCGCQYAHFGCCPDKVTIARGSNNEGCGCQYTHYGCCPDRHTEATGPKFEGCGCHTFQFGCCPDGVTPTTGPNQEGCHCSTSKYGCCSDGVTAAVAPDQVGCDCSSSMYGCCADGKTDAKGPNFYGCNEVPEYKQAACILTPDRGHCHNYSVYWYYDIVYGGCSRFWYGGCEGNDNRFDTKEECEDVCVQPPDRDLCKLPKIKGACVGYNIRWYYDSDRKQCNQFNYGGCLGNANNFVSQDLCEKKCEPEKSTSQCNLPIERGPCKGTFSRWGFNSDRHSCEQFVWGGCEGNSNRFTSESACMMRCNPPETSNPRCTLPQETGNCTETQALWSFSQTENRCLPFYYTGCMGNDNSFDSFENCTEACPSAYEPNECTLPAASGDCGNYREKWYYDTTKKMCSKFYYGGCGGNSNNFETLEECEDRCFEPPTPTEPPTTTPYSHDICQLPMLIGPCDESLARWFYDATSDSCSQFTYGGCDGNDNRFETPDECERRCKTGPGEETSTSDLTTNATSPSNTMSTPDTTATAAELNGCEVSRALEQCAGAGEVWYLDPTRGECVSHINSDTGATCRTTGVFESQEACERSCSVIKLNDECKLLPELGVCKSRYIMWYYDVARHECDQFMYSGCGGNNNRFETRNDCNTYCRSSDVVIQTTTTIITNITSSSAPITSTPSSSDPSTSYPSSSDPSSSTPITSTTTSSTPSSSTTTSSTPSSTTTSSSTPSFSTTTSSIPGSTVVDDGCQVSRALEQCAGAGEVWYLDPTRGECVSHINSDTGATCRTTGVFESQEACERSCGVFKDIDVCRYAMEPGQCQNYVPKYYFDGKSGSCKVFRYGGCLGGPNRFSTLDECMQVCKPYTDPCKQYPEEGNCQSRYVMWYYDETRDQCGQFVYTGCGGNNNRFETRDQCESQCKYTPSTSTTSSSTTISSTTTSSTAITTVAPDSTVIIDPCKQYPEGGNCLSRYVMWYYDETRDQCGQFIYTGCGGNNNRFKSREDCEGQCKNRNVPISTTTSPDTAPPQQVDEECRLPESLVPCGENVTVFYYDPNNRKCVESNIGGCRHANSYRTEEECERRCGAFKDINVCEALLNPGPCRESIPKFYWDSASGTCLPFTYGGCLGGANRFASVDECEEVCGSSGPVSPDCGSYNEECSRLQCEHGVVQTPTADGCERCSCKELVDKCESARQECTALECSYGVDRFTENDGCTRCRCLEHPCAILSCSGNQECVPKTYQDPITQETKYTAVCEESNEIEPDCDRFDEECAQLRCSYGVQRTRTAAGCERCACVQLEADCAVHERDCRALRCNYALEQYDDADGCQRCKCKEHPCDGVSCSPGERCVPSAYRDPVTQETKFTTVCNIVNKPGTCPPEELVSTESACQQRCYDDADCRGVGKCCIRGCSRLCLVPDSPTSPTPRTTTYIPDLPHAPQALPETEPEVTASEGGKATLRCLFHANPPPKITWTRGEIKIDGNVGRYRLLSDGALEIVSLYRNDSGVYICVADNGLGIARQEIRLQVSDPVETPVSIAGEQNAVISGEIGRSLVLRCLAYGYPQPNVFWYRGLTGPMVPFSSTLYEARGNILRINRLTYDTLGEYACQAYNGIGKPASWSIIVRAYRPVGYYVDNPYLIDRENGVYIPPIEPYTEAISVTTTSTTPEPDVFTVPVSTKLSALYTTISTGAELNLQCEVDGYPDPDIHWTKDGVRLEPSDRISITGTSLSRLAVYSVTVGDSGEYSCHANNEYSSHHSTAQITVQGLTIPAKCTDNQFFANCRLIVRSKYCYHKYYSKFCCKSCMEAGQLNPQDLEAQSDQSWSFRK